MRYKLSNGPWPVATFMKNRQVARGQAITIAQIDFASQNHFKLNSARDFSEPNENIVSKNLNEWMGELKA